MSGTRRHGPSGDHTASRAPDGAPLHCARHRPARTTLYRLVQRHAAEFIAHTETSTGSRLPRFVKDEFDARLEYGILAHGFLRLRCGECSHGHAVGVQLQAARLLPIVRCAAHVADGGATGRSGHPARTGAAVGAVAADPAAAAAGRAARADHAGAGRGAARVRASPAGCGGAFRRRRPTRSRDADPVLRPGGESERHSQRLVPAGVCRCGAEGRAAFVVASAPTEDGSDPLLRGVVARPTRMPSGGGVPLTVPRAGSRGPTPHACACRRIASSD